MKRGFILTESEKKRIKKLYGFVNEQNTIDWSDPKSVLTDTTKIQEFQTWLDKYYRNQGNEDGWAYSQKNGYYFVDQTPNRGFGRLGKKILIDSTVYISPLNLNEQSQIVEQVSEFYPSGLHILLTDSWKFLGVDIELMFINKLDIIE